jgi:hypothetical protein
MARRGIESVKSKYDFDNLSMSDMVGDPRTLSRAELKRRLNNLLGYEKLEINEEDENDIITFYTIERQSHTIRFGEHKGERRFTQIRHYDDSVFDPYEDVYHELKKTLGKLDINEMDDSGCERLAAAVLEEVFKDYKYAYLKSKSNCKQTREAGEAEMDLAVYKMTKGIGSTLAYLPPIDDVCKGLQAQVDKYPNRFEI